jgi:hypothetical protein
MDRSKCKDLQAVIEDGNSIYVQLILSEVKDYLHLLMMHPFGNFLIQKIFQARRGITLDQVNFIIKSIISDEQQLKQVCMNSHGYVNTIEVLNYGHDLLSCVSNAIDS